MSYSIDALTSGCYEGTSCLINKFDIKDELMIATIQAADGVTDYLRDIFKYAIKK